MIQFTEETETHVRSLYLSHHVYVKKQRLLKLQNNLLLNKKNNLMQKTIESTISLELCR